MYNVFCRTPDLYLTPKYLWLLSKYLWANLQSHCVHWYIYDSNICGSFICAQKLWFHDHTGHIDVWYNLVLVLFVEFKWFHCCYFKITLIAFAVMEAILYQNWCFFIHCINGPCPLTPTPLGFIQSCCRIFWRTVKKYVNLCSDKIC